MCYTYFMKTYIRAGGHTKANSLSYKSQVDPSEYQKLLAHRWSCALKRGKPYLYRKGKVTEGDRAKKTIQFTYAVLDIKKLPKGKVIDHINGDTLDNRKENLRICSIQQNSYNSNYTNKGHRGVHWDKENKKWKAAIRNGGKNLNLGRFSDQKEAIDVYKTKSVELRGEFSSYFLKNNTLVDNRKTT